MNRLSKRCIMSNTYTAAYVSNCELKRVRATVTEDINGFTHSMHHNCSESLSETKQHFGRNVKVHSGHILYVCSDL